MIPAALPKSTLVLAARRRSPAGTAAPGRFSDCLGPSGML